MKKTLLSIGAALAVIDAVFAVPSKDDRKRICEKSLGHLWIEKTETCIDKNPCKSDSQSIREAYCNTVFANIQLPSSYMGEKVVEIYAQKVLGLSGYTWTFDVEEHIFGQDYIPYNTRDGGYVLFEFDDLWDMGKSDAYAGVVESACIIYGGSFYKDNTLSCGDLSEKDCTEAVDFANGLLSQNRDYYGVMIPEYDGQLCKFNIEGGESFLRDWFD